MLTAIISVIGVILMVCKVDKQLDHEYHNNKRERWEALEEHQMDLEDKAIYKELKELLK